LQRTDPFIEMGSTKENPFQIPRKLTDMSSIVYFYRSLHMTAINFSSSTDVGNMKYLSYAGSLLPTGLRSPHQAPLKSGTIIDWRLARRINSETFEMSEVTILMILSSSARRKRRNSA